jgi:hypothetical protein
VEPFGSATSVSRAEPGSTSRRRNTARRRSGDSASYESHNCCSRTPGSVPSGARGGSPTVWRSDVSATSQTMMPLSGSRSAPAGTDQCTRACDRPCASGALPIGTPGGSGGGIGATGTGLAALVSAGDPADGDNPDGMPISSWVWIHSAIPQREVAE